MAKQYGSFSSKAGRSSCCTLTYVLLSATAGASTVNIIPEMSHVKNKLTKKSSCLPYTAVAVTALQTVQQQDHVAGCQEPLKPAAPLKYNHIL